MTQTCQKSAQPGLCCCISGGADHIQQDCRGNNFVLALQVKEYAALYQRCAWDPLLAIISQPEAIVGKKSASEMNKVRNTAHTSDF